jgi:hypothetical protein
MPYSGNPATSPVDEVRFWLQDTSQTPDGELLNDLEINYMIEVTKPEAGGNAVLVASYCCAAILSKYAGEVAVSGDGINYSGDQLQAKYKDLQAMLRYKYNMMMSTGCGPIYGANHGSVGAHPIFGLGQFDNPQAGEQSFNAFREFWHDRVFIDPANYPMGG